MNTFQKIGYLQDLCNKYGDFKVAKAWRGADGELYWTKHRSVLECWETPEGLRWLEGANNRQILPVELVIDLDENPTIERFNEICDHLEKEGQKFKGYHTGSRGYHIHLWSNKFAMYDKVRREKLRILLCTKFKADIAKKSENVMIALEDTPHWKTGKLKTLLRQYPNDRFY